MHNDDFGSPALPNKDEFNLNDMLKSVSEIEKLRARAEMNTASVNLDFLSDRCDVCGHCPVIKGGIGCQRIVLCEHQIDWLKKDCRVQKGPSIPFAQTMFGLEITTPAEEKERDLLT